jgi:hypothetical protein
MLRNQSAALFVTFVACLHGCATMVHGRTQIVEVDSAPKGATATIQPGGDVIVTPSQVSLSRKSSYVVHFKKAGYEPASVTLVSKASTSLWRNAVWIHPVGWIIGAIVDVSTGGGYDLQPEKVEVRLVPSSGVDSHHASGSGQ